MREEFLNFILSSTIYLVKDIILYRNLLGMYLKELNLMGLETIWSGFQGGVAYQMSSANA